MNAAIFRLIYRYGLYPLLRAGFALLALTNQKIKRGLSLRAADSTSGLRPWLRGAARSRPIWIHCASGEFEYAKPVITLLKERAPTVPVLVSYFSPSIQKAVEMYPGVDLATPSPWDRPADLNAFLTHHQPRALLIARTDTWPMMLHCTRLANVPILLFSATLAATSGRARGIGRLISRLVFADLTSIFCVSSDDLRVFTDLGCGEKTVIAGDTRYDQVQARLRHPKTIRLDHFTDPSSRATLVAGSTWPEDEAVALPLAVALQSRLRMILVPHEPDAEHLEKIETDLRSMGLTSVRYSQTASWHDEDVLLVDTVGILAELYACGDFAFVGGSFRKTVHSVMEPVAAGALTFVGPRHHNNREALALQSEPSAHGFHCVEVVTDTAAFIARLRQALALSASDLHAVQTANRQAIEQRSGKSRAVLEWCATHLQLKPVGPQENANSARQTN